MAAGSPEEVAQAYAHAVDCGDLDAAMEHWAEDAVFVAPDGSVMEGRPKIRLIILILIEATAGFRLDEVYAHTAGDVGVCVGTMTITLKVDPDLSPWPTQGRFTTVYARENGGPWRFKVIAPWGFPDR
jgi:ketosteroid isomerase-like protein